MKETINKTKRQRMAEDICKEYSLQRLNFQNIQTVHTTPQKQTTQSGVPIVAQQKGVQVGIMRLQVQSLTSLSRLRIQCCHELCWRSQARLRSGVGLSCSSDSTHSLGTSICCECGPKKQKQQQQKKPIMAF